MGKRFVGARQAVFETNLFQLKKELAFRRIG
ncbi:hypothetical protein PL10110_610051 [Planktothrix agardhii]|nr:hypothetical protein PL10110_610051 [Planktothrix agardhii]